jgi:hypothetical protein
VRCYKYLKYKYLKICYASTVSADIVRGTSLFYQLVRGVLSVVDEAKHGLRATPPSIAKDAQHILEIARSVNSGTELELERIERSRIERLKQLIEVCCPPEIEPPFCDHQPCPQPPDFGERPPRIDYKPIPEPPPLGHSES